MTLTLRQRSPIFGASGLLVAVLLQTSWAQNENPFQAPKSADRIPESEFDVPARIISGATVPPTITFREATAGVGPDFQKAVEQLRDAKDGEPKEKARAHLHDMLTEYFEKDMARRLADLKQMEERLKKLHDQLERRQTKRDEIIDLQIQVLVNQAEGLGFFSNEQTSNPRASFESMYWYSPRPTEPSAPVGAASSARPARPAPVAPLQERYIAPQPATEAQPAEPDATQLLDPGDRPR
jgi:hypothetical protein